MRVRVLLMASVAAAVLAAASTQMRAQDSGSFTTELPAVEVAPPKTEARTTVRRARPASRPAATAAHRTAVTRVGVYPTTPIATPSTALAVDKVPGSINFVNTPDIQRTNSLNVMDALQQNVAGLNISNVAGNDFQANVEFRGFVASPVSGTPQGLAVYQNGVRVNEAFGDTINWDLIPTAAIKSIAVVTNNPAYGLNALGGAVSVQMKDGFNYHGAEVDLMGGSFGRLQSSLQWGKQIGDWSVYTALEGVHDDGYRYFGQSDIRRFYGDVGYRNDSSEFHLNMGAAQNNFGASATTPLELLDQYWGAVYTTPQTSQNQVGYLNLTGKVDVTPSWTLEGVAHYRAFNQQTVDGNPTGTQLCDPPNQALLCFGDGIAPANGMNGQQLANPFPAGSFLGEIDRTVTNTNTGGASLQATNTDQLFGHDNRFVVGTSFDASVTHFGSSAELGTIGTDYVVSGSGIFLGTSGNPASDGPVSLRATNQYTGLYALDTFDVTKALSVTAGGRFNDARIVLQDQIGTALNGNEVYDRFNPMIGATYKITPELTAYAGYSEANRAPTPLELECADPNHPCILATFLVSDPPLKQVVSHTYEAGFRGTHDFSFGTLDWKFGGFRATNTDDILEIPSLLQGFGYFQNVGNTRRQGIEAEANLRSSRWQFHASYAFIDARFLDSLQLGSNSPAADANGNIQVLPGDIIPAIPRHRIKASFDYSVTDAFKVGGDALWVSSQYLVGDASNQEPQLPSYAVFSAHASYQLDKTYQIYGRVDNILDNRYYTYGGFFDTTQLPNFYTGNQFTDARSLAPARPRAFYLGMKATF